ncbi:MAG TPA: hypothetical protein VM324_08610 [Egibacteraceae bacterium]|nr:hypothetical protein [Egibacteraceae bacterium]
MVCLRGTDTAIAVRGEAEAAIAFLMGGFGIPSEQASAIVSTSCGMPPGRVPVGVHDWGFRLCGDCAASETKPLPVGPVGQVPVITLPG